MWSAYQISYAAIELLEHRYDMMSWPFRCR
jgi:hypothetical protein